MLCAVCWPQAVSDAAQGGMILMSDMAFMQLQPSMPKLVPDVAIVLHDGMHEVNVNGVEHVSVTWQGC